jgi:hypothetical protein
MSPEIKLRRIGVAARKFRGKTSGQKLRWPDKFQEKVLAVMVSGVSVMKVSRATGIASGTLAAWRARSKPKSKGAGFKKLKVVDGQKSVVQSRSPVKVFVTTSHGSEIQGLSADEVAKLIRRGVL